jgi:hypothetical protein
MTARQSGASLRVDDAEASPNFSTRSTRRYIRRIKK